MSGADCGDDEQLTIDEVIELHKKGAFKKLRIIALDNEGMIREYAFKSPASCHQEACLLTT